MTDPHLPETLISERSAQIAAFLAAAGWAGAQVAPLAGDASFRKYLRVRLNGWRAVLMDAPPTHEDVRPFVRIDRHLRDLGLSAPEIVAADETNGLLLLEDFGDKTFTRLLAGGADEIDLYQLAVDVLIHLHRLPGDHALPDALPAYDLRRLLDEALLLVDWYLPAVTGAPADPGARRAFEAAWSEVLVPIAEAPPTLVLRDFHVDNLMRLSGRDGLAACGLLDFQDAVAGHPAYDLMSLVEDARRDVPPSVKAAMLARYAAAMGNAGTPSFQRAFAVLAAQRHSKVIGIFTRLCWRDGKPLYLQHIPRVWRLLEAALADPALAAVAGWLDRHLPASCRIVPACTPTPA